jgi:hypothetical protein
MISTDNWRKFKRNGGTEDSEDSTSSEGRTDSDDSDDSNLSEEEECEVEDQEEHEVHQESQEEKLEENFFSSGFLFIAESPRFPIIVPEVLDPVWEDTKDL